MGVELVVKPLSENALGNDTREEEETHKNPQEVRGPSFPLIRLLVCGSESEQRMRLWGLVEQGC